MHDYIFLRCSKWLLTLACHLFRGITKQLLWCLFLTDFLLHFLSYEFLKIIFI